LDEVAAWQSARKAAGLAAPRVGAAVAVGPVLFGAVGDETRLEYTVIGEAVNLAAKLEKHTKAAGVRALATAEAESLARAQGYAPRAPKPHRPLAHVEGVGDPLELVILG
jgi:adenylate cyclase